MPEELTSSGTKKAGRKSHYLLTRYVSPSKNSRQNTTDVLLTLLTEFLARKEET